MFFVMTGPSRGFDTFDGLYVGDSDDYDNHQERRQNIRVQPGWKPLYSQATCTNMELRSK